MTWSYSPTLTTDKDRVRRMIGDVVGTPTVFQLISDEEILAILVDQPVPTYAAAAICDSLAAQFSVQVDKSIGATSINLSRRAQAFAELAARLRAGGPGSMAGGDGTGERAGGMFVGGLDVSANDEARRDTSVEQSSFRVGQDDRPGVPTNRQVSDWDPTI